MTTDDTAVEIAALWARHRDADWPPGLGASEGELMTLDTVIGGCIAYFLDEHSLDPQRIGMLTSCLDELRILLDGLEPDAQPYFRRLQQLGSLLLRRESPA